MSELIVGSRVGYTGRQAIFAGLLGTVIKLHDTGVEVQWDNGWRFPYYYTEVAPMNKPCTANTRATDPVNRPQHYASGEIECIDAIRASMTKEAFCGYLKGNVQKYMWRYEKKINPVEDIKKARWYSERLVKELEDA